MIYEDWAGLEGGSARTDVDIYAALIICGSGEDRRRALQRPRRGGKLGIGEASLGGGDEREEGGKIKHENVKRVSVHQVDRTSTSSLLFFLVLSVSRLDGSSYRLP